MTGMTRFEALLLAFALLLVSSCAKDEFQAVCPNDGLFEIKAFSEEPSTKTEVDGNGDVYWSKGDKIGVLTKYTNYPFETSVTSKSKVATFTGKYTSSSTYLGLYPYSETALTDGNTVTTTLSAEQTGMAGSFDRNLFIAIAKTTDASTMSFRSVCSGVRFKASATGITSVEFKANGGEHIAGTFNVGIDDSGIPAIGMDREASSKVTLRAPDSQGFVPGNWYYIVTLPATLQSGFTMTYVKDGIPYSVKSTKSVTLVRSRFGSLDGVDSKASLEMTADSGLYWEEETFANKVRVTYSGTKVTVTSTHSAITYGSSGAHAWVNLGDVVNGKKAEIIVSGTSTNGSLKIYGEKKFKLTLNGVSLTSGKGPAINSQNGKKMYLHLAPGTTNSLTDAATYVNDIYYVSGASASTEKRKGCLFSEGRIILSGTGSLKVTGKHGNAIATDDYFFMRPGPTVTIPSAVGHGLKVGGISTPDSDDYDVDGDLIGCTIAGGNLDIAVSSPATKAINCEGNFKMTGGNVRLTTSGDAQLVTENGVKDVTSSACLKVDKNLKITGGSLTCKSTGIAGKGINVDGSIEIGTSTGGKPTLNVSTLGKNYGTLVDASNPMSSQQSSEPTSIAKAIKADGNITMHDGDVTVYTAGLGAEGLESKSPDSSSIRLEGGQVKMYCNDDCINSAGSVIFSGVEAFLCSANNDGIDSNDHAAGAITISGGVVISIAASGNKEEGFDSDNAALVVSGGYAFSMGGAQGMGASMTNNTTTTQGAVMLKGLNLTQGTYLSLLGPDRDAIFSVRIPVTLSGSYSFMTCPELRQGNNYSIRIANSMPHYCLERWTYENPDPAYSVGFFKGGQSSSATDVTNFKLSNKSQTIKLL